MSTLANWSYKAVATVRPWLGEDTEQGGEVFGEPYEILCSWEAGGKEQRLISSTGVPFLPTFELWTESALPKHLDRITIAGTPIQDVEIRAVQGYGMEMFDDLPDYRLSL